MTALALGALAYLVTIGLAVRLLLAAGLAALPTAGRWARGRYLLALLACVATFLLAGTFLLAAGQGGEVAGAGLPGEASWGRSSANPMLEPARNHWEARWRYLTLGAPGRWLILGWIGVGGLLALRRLVQGWRLARRERTWRPVGPRLLRSWGLPAGAPAYRGPAGVPMAVGIARPRLFLPDWLIDDLEVPHVALVARHEFAHVRWRDPAIDGALSWLCIVCWPVWPLWSLAATARREREAAADQAALAPGDGRGPRAYAEALLSVAGHDRNGPLPVVGAVGDLERRVEQLLFPPARRPVRSLGAAVPGAALLLVMATSPVPAGTAALLPPSTTGEHVGRWGLLDHFLGYNPVVEVVVVDGSPSVRIQGEALSLQELARWQQAESLAARAQIVAEAERRALPRGPDPPGG